MADVSSHATVAVMNTATRYDPATNAGAGLDENEIVGVVSTDQMLAQSHEVGVVVHEDWHAKNFPEKGACLYAIPSRHPGRRDHFSFRETDRAGQAHPNAKQP